MVRAVLRFFVSVKLSVYLITEKLQIEVLTYTNRWLAFRLAFIAWEHYKPGGYRLGYLVNCVGLPPLCSIIPLCPPAFCPHPQVGILGLQKTRNGNITYKVASQQYLEAAVYAMLTIKTPLCIYYKKMI